MIVRLIRYGAWRRMQLLAKWGSDAGKYVLDELKTEEHIVRRIKTLLLTGGLLEVAEV
jgi:hypothetical protein